MPAEHFLIRAPNWLGDAVMAIPAIHALRSAHPDAYLVVDARPGIAPLFGNVRGVDETQSCPASGGFGDFAAKRSHAATLRRMAFDTGLLFTNSFSTACLMYVSGPKRRIGLATSFRSWLLTDAVSLTPELRVAHQTVWYGAVAARAGAGTNLDVPAIVPSAQAREEAHTALTVANLADARYAVLAPGSAYGPAKDWLAERFVELARRLVGADLRVVITGSGKDAEQAGRIAEQAGPGAVSLAGKTGLPGFLGVLAGAACFVGNDSGAAHCAAAVGIPAVAVFGSTQPGRTRPLGLKVACVVGNAPCAPCMRRVCPENPPMACMASVTVDQVWNELRQLGVVS